MQEFKKNESVRYIPDTHSGTWDDIRKTLITSFITASITLAGFAIITYFTVISNTTRIDALESESVRSDVQLEINKSISDKLDIVSQDVRDIKTYLLNQE